MVLQISGFSCEKALVQIDFHRRKGQPIWRFVPESPVPRAGGSRPVPVYILGERTLHFHDRPDWPALHPSWGVPMEVAGRSGPTKDHAVIPKEALGWLTNAGFGDRPAGAAAKKVRPRESLENEPSCSPLLGRNSASAHGKTSSLHIS